MKHGAGVFAFLHVLEKGANALRLEFNYEVQQLVSLGRWTFHGIRALPPNKGMQPTVKSVTAFAGAKAAPLFPAADPRR